MLREVVHCRGHEALEDTCTAVTWVTGQRDAMIRPLPDDHSTVTRKFGPVSSSVGCVQCSGWLRIAWKCPARYCLMLTFGIESCCSSMRPLGIITMLIR